MKIAYEKNDLKTVKSILTDLEQGEMKEREVNLSEKIELKKELNHLRTIRQKIENELCELTKSDAFMLIKNIGDWNEYFKLKSKELKDYIKNLI